MKTLDLDSVRAFILVAELRSFTRAAQALNTTQSAVSLKLKRLEEQLDRRLFERTPRLVRLSPHGGAFLQPARELLSAHDRAVAGVAVKSRRLSIGVSEHVAGSELPTLLQRLNAYDPTLVMEVHIGGSRDLLATFDNGELDAALVRQDERRRDGEFLFEEPVHWCTSPLYEWRADEPLRLINLPKPCSVRAMAVQALDMAGVHWTEVFVGGGSSAVGAAVTAGLGVAAIARCVRPVGAVDAGPVFGLPDLAASKIVLYSTVTDRSAQGALRTLAATLRSAKSRASA